MKFWSTAKDWLQLQSTDFNWLLVLVFKIIVIYCRQRLKQRNGIRKMMFSCQLRHWIVTKITTRVYCMSTVTRLDYFFMQLQLCQLTQLCTTQLGWVACWFQLNDNWLQLQLHEKSVQLTTQLDLESLLNHTAMCSLPLTHMAVHLGLYKPSR